MIAYNKEWLYNMHVRRQTDDALLDGCISAETHGRIMTERPVGFYKVGFWASVGFGLVTWLIIGAVTGLLAISFRAEIDSSVLWIFIGLVCYGLAEWVIYGRKHYNSGIDNILMWTAAVYLQFGVILALTRGESNSSEIMASLVVFIISGAMAIRFGDQLLSVAAALGALFFVYFVWLRIGPLHKVTAPFIIIVAAALLYFISAKYVRSYALLYYRYCLQCINILALIALYAGGNYFIVMGILVEGSYYQTHVTLPILMSWFYWTWTFLIPVIYIAAGIRMKNIMHIRVGAVLVVAAILTFRYYHSVMSKEAALIIAGIIMVVISYALIKHLHEPKKGFTFQPRESKSAAEGNITGKIIEKGIEQM